MLKLFVLLCLLASGVVARAQGRLLLDEDQARKNLIASKPPVLPPGVHRSGKVGLLVQIGPDGRVTSAKADTGPSMLRDAAVDAVKQWRFKPFKIHDEKVTASTKITVDFSETAASAKPVAPSAAVASLPATTLPATPLPVAPVTAPVDETLQRFEAAEEQCRTLVNAHGDATQQARFCRSAADQAASLKSANHFVLQRSADVYAATALMRTDELKLAIAYGSKAVQAVGEGHDDDAGASAAYTVRGQAKAFAGDLAGADLDLTKAEASERRVVAAATGKPDEADSRAGLKNLLLFHAKLLKGLKQPDKAAVKLAEADKL